MLLIRRLVLAVLCAVVAIVISTPALAAAGTKKDPRLVDPRTHQARYQTLAAEWWQWALSTPGGTGGPFGSGPVDCAVNQPHKHVLFLAAPFNASGTVHRTCTESLRPSTRIFFPVINTECSNVEPKPFYGGTARARRICVNKKVFNPAHLTASVDGHSLPVSEGKFDIVSRDFAFTAVPGNPVGLSGTGRSTTRGVWVLLKPLHKGHHTITFAGSYPALNFSVSGTYDLEVA